MLPCSNDSTLQQFCITASEKHSMFNQGHSVRFNLLGVMQTNPVIMQLLDLFDQPVTDATSLNDCVLVSITNSTITRTQLCVTDT